MAYDLSLKLVDHDNLSRLKWEYEVYRTDYKDMICMGTADMDFMSPDPILQAIHHVADRGHLGYPMIPDAYYEAIHDWLMRKTSWDIDTMQSVCHNQGIYISGWSILDVLTKPGDKIVILSPVHFCFKRMIDMNQRVTIKCPLVQVDGHYTIDENALEACLASGAKLLWICNPHNPVGRAWSRAELQLIADLCVKYDVQILSDDVYCGLIFPGTEYVPIASLSKEVSYRTVTLYSTSKSYNTTGLLHSYIVTENPETMKRYESAKKGVAPAAIIMAVGLMIASFMAAGTVPTVLVLGLKAINPSVFLLVTFILCCITSLITGTSWGTIGTVGVAMIGVGTGLGANLAITAGAIVSGAYFGDKMSPISDSTILASTMTGTELWTHIGRMCSCQSWCR